MVKTWQLIIGIAFGLLLFMFLLFGGCSLLIASTLPKAIEETEQMMYETEKQIEQEQKEFQEEIEKAFDINPKEEKSKEEFKFPKTSIVNTEKGVSISIDTFEVEDKGNWGKITKIKTTILNEGDNSITPTIGVRIYDKGEKDSKTDGLIEFDEWTLQVGEHITKESTKDISFIGNGTKVLKLTVYDGWFFDKTYIASVEKEFEMK